MRCSRRNAASRTYLHTGDLGDLIAALPVMRHFGRGKLVITEKANLPLGIGVRETMRGARYAFLQPLLAVQPYLSAVCWQDTPRGVTHDFSEFRRSYWQARGLTLTEWQATHMGIGTWESVRSTGPWLDMSSWLDVKPSKKSKGRVVVARSHRYRNGMWQCRALMERYGERVMFIGTSEEHADFQTESMLRVEHYRVKDALEMAQLIAGCALFVGNQSFPWWVACGVGAPFIQESWPTSLDCYVPRSNGQFTRNADEVWGLRWPELLPSAAL